MEEGPFRIVLGSPTPDRQSILDAMMRAAFLLRTQGNGAYDLAVSKRLEGVVEETKRLDAELKEHQDRVEAILKGP